MAHGHREKIPQKQSERYFTQTAQRVHPKNIAPANPMRGGIRL